MQTLRYVLCDVFTELPLTGNPLAVFTNPKSLRDESMQAIAREMNLSETVFVFAPESGGHARLRIFTPRHELPFAGHPTLGAAFVIGTMVQLDVLELETRAGTVPVRLQREGARVTFGTMSQPLPKRVAFEHEAELLAALGGVRATEPLFAYDNGARHVYVRLSSREEVAQLEPDFGALLALGRKASFGVNVFSGTGADYKLRMFHPAAGVSEAPATGSAAGPLAAHLALSGQIALGQELRIEQGAELQRPSQLYASAHSGPGGLERVEVGGCAVIVARGEFKLLI